MKRVNIVQWEVMVTTFTLPTFITVSCHTCSILLLPFVTFLLCLIYKLTFTNKYMRKWNIAYIGFDTNQFQASICQWSWDISTEYKGWTSVFVWFMAAQILYILPWNCHIWTVLNLIWRQVQLFATTVMSVSSSQSNLFKISSFYFFPCYTCLLNCVKCMCVLYVWPTCTHR